ncbi:MAG TPA: hypothetical protein VKE49_01055 [Myxococcaceae bacterium]|nr:hypothetical protein [Myxococcaceae bacterium]
MESDQEKPPFFKSWNGAYLLVIAVLAALVALFSVLTQVYQ